MKFHEIQLDPKITNTRMLFTFSFIIWSVLSYLVSYAAKHSTPIYKKTSNELQVLTTSLSYMYRTPILFLYWLFQSTLSFIKQSIQLKNIFWIKLTESSEKDPQMAYKKIPKRYLTRNKSFEFRSYSEHRHSTSI